MTACDPSMTSMVAFSESMRPGTGKARTSSCWNLMLRKCSRMRRQSTVRFGLSWILYRPSGVGGTAPNPNTGADNDGPATLRKIRNLFREAGVESLAEGLTSDQGYVIGTHRLGGSSTPAPKGQRWFEFGEVA